ncbi:MAG TPA: hypothetical protein VIN72_12240 [Lutibacter sp.]
MNIFLTFRPISFFGNEKKNKATNVVIYPIFSSKLTKLTLNFSPTIFIDKFLIPNLPRRQAGLFRDLSILLQIMICTAIQNILHQLKDDLFMNPQFQELLKQNSIGNNQKTYSSSLMTNQQNKQ